ncbi:MAG: hypothetical protein ACKOCH_06470 [Bacteroidota bacterium]
MDLLTDYLLKIFKIPRLPEEMTEEIWLLMLQDKKNASGNVRITLPDAPRSMRILNISRSDLEGSMAYYNSLI